jgi:hypothetical protein
MLGRCGGGDFFSHLDLLFLVLFIIILVVRGDGLADLPLKGRS